jgi:hypothetical protein
MGNITTTKNLQCDKWCELGIWLDVPWKEGWLGLIANNNGHHYESKFDNGDEHRDLHTNILQTFLVQLHEQEQSLSKLLKHVGEETIDDPMLHGQFKCAPLF